MSDSGIRLVAVAIVVLAGSIAMGLGDLAQSTAKNYYRGGAQTVGTLLVVVGCVLFLVLLFAPGNTKPNELPVERENVTE